MTALYLCSVSV
jgi:hypothetical protein